MNFTKRLICLILVVTFLFSGASLSLAESPSYYISLGDSIAYGMSADSGKGFVESFYSYLKALKPFNKLELKNFGVPGATSTDLLKKLQEDESVKSALKSARYVTVSIGGNNILGPIIAAAAKAFEVDPTSGSFAQDLSNKIKEDPEAQEKITAALTSEELIKAITDGSTALGTDLVPILKELRLLAPQARIYALTLINPELAKDPAYAEFDTAIKKINSYIRTGAFLGGYTTVDAYSAFVKYSDSDPIVNFNIKDGLFDPHPTNKGHELIYKTLLAAAKSDIEIDVNDALVKEKESASKSTSSSASSSSTLSLSSSKYKIDNTKNTISLKAKSVALKTFSASIKASKGASIKVLTAKNKSLTSGNVVPGCKVIVTASNTKSSKTYLVTK